MTSEGQCLSWEKMLMCGGEEYLGIHIKNRQKWKINIKAVSKKGVSRLHFSRKLRSFNMCSKMLKIFLLVCYDKCSLHQQTGRKADKLDKFEAVVKIANDNHHDNPDQPLRHLRDRQHFL